MTNDKFNVEKWIENLDDKVWDGDCWLWTGDCLILKFHEETTCIEFSMMDSLVFALMNWSLKILILVYDLH